MGGTHFNDTAHRARHLLRRASCSAFRRRTATGPTSAAPSRARSTSTPSTTWARACGSRRCGSGTRARYLADVANLIANNTRAPHDIIGDMQAQAEATLLAEREIQRLCEKYGVETIKTAFAEVQDYVEQLTRARVAKLPDGTWETEDYIDQDPVLGEGLIPIKLQAHDRGRARSTTTCRARTRRSPPFLNAGFGGSFAGDRGGNEDPVPRPAAELRLLPRRDARLGPRGHGRELRLADARAPGSARGRSRRS